MSISKRSKKMWLISSVVGLIIVAVVITLIFDPLSLFASRNESRKAVFLTNGQVYFGYMTEENNQYITLEKIYYLKSVETANEGKISLVKLGSEVYGPEDSMKINRDHILYYENMRDNSKIAEAINKSSVSK